MPLRNFHACRLVDPDQFQEDTIRQIQRKSVNLIIGRPHGMTKTRVQSIRYPTEIWSKTAARRSCAQRDGIFEPAEPKLGELGRMKKPFWQITRNEFIDHYLKEAYKAEYGSLKGFKVWLDSPLSRREVSIATMNADDDHYEIVADAIKEGKPVPAKVLKDYPTLKEVKVKKTKPLPADAEKPTDLTLNSHVVTCYGKPTGRGYKVYCRRKD